MLHRLLTLFLLVMIVSPLQAQNTTSSKVTLDARDITLTAAFTQISETSTMPILLWGVPDQKITASFQEMPLETILNVICKSKSLQWRKLWAQPGDDGKLDPGKLVKALTAIEELKESGLVIQDPGSKTTSLALRNIPEEIKIEPSKLPGAPSLKPVYLVYSKGSLGTVVISRSTDAAAVATDKTKDSVSENNSDSSDSSDEEGFTEDANQKVADYAHDQASALNNLQNMTPAERRVALNNNLQQLKQMPRNLRRDMGRVGLRTFFSLSAAERQQIVYQLRKQRLIPKNTPIPGSK